MDWTIDFNDIIRGVFWFAAAIAVLSAFIVLGALIRRRLPAVSAARERALLKSSGARRNALRLLRGSDTAGRILAAETLTQLREMSALPDLRRAACEPDPVLSLAAARAALQLDEAFAPEFVQLMIERRDWSPVRVHAAVQESRALLAGPIVAAIAGADAAVARSLIGYLPLFGPARSLPVLRGVLETSTDAGAIARALAALGLIGEPEDALYASALRAHEDARVRIQAANALGRTGDASHVELLGNMLNDANWWVRYRAAQAIARIEKGQTAALRVLLDSTQDRYARDMLVQTISEQSAREQAGRS